MSAADKKCFRTLYSDELVKEHFVEEAAGQGRNAPGLDLGAVAFLDCAIATVLIRAETLGVPPQRGLAALFDTKACKNTELVGIFAQTRKGKKDAQWRTLFSKESVFAHFGRQLAAGVYDPVKLSASKVPVLAVPAGARRLAFPLREKKSTFPNDPGEFLAWGNNGKRIVWLQALPAATVPPVRDKPLATDARFNKPYVHAHVDLPPGDTAGAEEQRRYAATLAWRENVMKEVRVEVKRVDPFVAMYLSKDAVCPDSCIGAGARRAVSPHCARPTRRGGSSRGAP